MGQIPGQYVRPVYIKALAPEPNQHSGSFSIHDTATLRTIESLLNAHECCSPLHSQPPLVGLVVLSTFVINWRSYLAFYEEEELRMVGSELLQWPSSSRLDLTLPLVKNCH